MNYAAILNHVWQSTVFALAAAGVAWGLRRHAARARFWVWMAASLKFLVPFAALAGLGQWLAWLLAMPAATSKATPAALAAVSQPFQTLWLQTAGAASAAGGASLPWGWLLAAAWAAGSVALGLRWARRWRQMAGIARAARPGAEGGLAVGWTAAAVEPGVFGIWRPVLLLPASLQARLAPAQWNAVVAHERCHLRRRDNLWAALHMLVETIFWFHPLVWWLGGRLVGERERACDEAVLQQGGDREAYASGILQVCRHYLESPLACAAGIGGGALAQRVADILAGGRSAQLGRGRKWALASLGTLALAGPLAGGLVFGQAKAPAPTSFDAASIKAAAPPSGNRIFKGLRAEPKRLTAQNMSLKELIEVAYNLKPYQVVGPAWMDSELFDVTAETSEPLPRDQMERLLAPFLEQQFKLQTHRETKVMPVYALVVAEGGAKLKPPGPAGVAPTYKVEGRGGARGPLPPGAFMIGMSGQALSLTGNATTDGLTNLLTRQVDRPILNLTGLTGNYEVHLSYAPPARFFQEMRPAARLGGGAGAPPPPGGAAPDGHDDSAAAAAPAPSLFTALQQQLGLKLDPRKAPIELLVVDKAEKAPVGN